MKSKFYVLLLLFTLALPSILIGQPAQEIDSTAIDAINFDPEEATLAYLNLLTPEQKEKSDNYFEGGYWLILWNLIYGLVVAWLFLSKGISKKIKSIAAKAGNINIQNLIYFGLYFITAYVLSFPLNLYEGFFREHQYDLSNLTFGGWLQEELIGLLVAILIGSLALALLYKGMRILKETWWAWGGLFSLFLLLILFFVGPIWISPLFNDYKPLADEKVKEEILSMARANSVPVDNVYQFDASKQSDRISANVSGIGSTIRISLNDNLLNRCTPAEVKAVMGHELGHYVLNHSYEGLIYFTIIIFGGLGFVHVFFKKALNKWGTHWNFSDISDVSGFPLFIVLFSIYLFLAQPAINSIIRTNEMESDVFGLNAAQEPDGFALTAIKLSEYRKIEPGYWEEILMFDHPSGRTRVSTAMKWKAEHLKD